MYQTDVLITKVNMMNKIPESWIIVEKTGNELINKNRKN